MRRELGQLSLADGLVAGVGRNGALERIRALVDWTAFARLRGGIYAAPVGRPSYGPLPLLKCLLLPQWYRLSDPGLEEALGDRLSRLGLVRQALLTDANVSEHTTAPDLIQGDEDVFYGDAGYDSRALRRQLRRTGIGDGIIHAARHHLPLTEAQRQRNGHLQPLRAEVERTFAVMKRLYGYARVRY